MQAQVAFSYQKRSVCCSSFSRDGTYLNASNKKEGVSSKYPNHVFKTPTLNPYILFGRNIIFEKSEVQAIVCWL